MSGNGGNIVATFRDLDLVIVITRTRYNTRSMHQETRALIDRYILPTIAEC